MSGYHMPRLAAPAHRFSRVQLHHPLTCHFCNSLISEKGAAFQCSECSAAVHAGCVDKIQTKQPFNMCYAQAQLPNMLFQARTDELLGSGAFVKLDVWPDKNVMYVNKAQGGSKMTVTECNLGTLVISRKEDRKLILQTHERKEVLKFESQGERDQCFQLLFCLRKKRPQNASSILSHLGAGPGGSGGGGGG
eukprot:RCo050442